jgi:sulfoacetaldehyde acetyltransferase
MSKSGANLPTGPQKMTPSEAFVETMVANKVKDIFGIMGSAFMDAMDIFAPAGIRLIQWCMSKALHTWLMAMLV